MKMNKNRLASRTKNKSCGIQAEELMQVVNLQIANLEDFISLLNQEERLLVCSDFSSLAKVKEKQEENLRSATKLEEKRKDLTKALQRKIGLEHQQGPGNPLGELVRLCGSTELEKLQLILLNLHRKVKIQKEKNDKLIKQSLNCIDNNRKGLGEKPRWKVELPLLD